MPGAIKEVADRARFSSTDHAGCEAAIAYLQHASDALHGAPGPGPIKARLLIEDAVRAIGGKVVG